METVWSTSVDRMRELAKDIWTGPLCNQRDDVTKPLDVYDVDWLIEQVRDEEELDINDIKFLTGELEGKGDD